jgi:hypothetical protein
MAKPWPAFKKNLDECEYFNKGKRQPIYWKVFLIYVELNKIYLSKGKK